MACSRVVEGLPPWEQAIGLLPVLAFGLQGSEMLGQGLPAA